MMDQYESFNGCGLLLYSDYDREYKKLTYDSITPFFEKWLEVNGNFRLPTGVLYEDKKTFDEEYERHMTLVSKDGDEVDYIHEFDVGITAMGFRLIPIFNSNGTLNVKNPWKDTRTVYTWDEVSGATDLRFLFIPALHPCSAPDIYNPEETQYNTPQEIIDEFKERFSKYLPEDFDWYGNIGWLSYTHIETAY